MNEWFFSKCNCFFWYEIFCRRSAKILKQGGSRCILRTIFIGDTPSVHFPFNDVKTLYSCIIFLFWIFLSIRFVLLSCICTFYSFLGISSPEEASYFTVKKINFSILPSFYTINAVAGMPYSIFLRGLQQCEWYEN